MKLEYELFNLGKINILSKLYSLQQEPEPLFKKKNKSLDRDETFLTIIKSNRNIAIKSQNVNLFQVKRAISMLPHNG